MMDGSLVGQGTQLVGMGGGLWEEAWMGRGGSDEVGEEVGNFEDDLGLAVLFDHVEALLDYFGAFLGLLATGEEDGGDIDAAWEKGEGSQGVCH